MITTSQRVAVNTSGSINARIRAETEANIMRFATAGREAITQRLKELDSEWDVERALEANAAIASLTGAALGATVNRKFFFVPFIVGGFLLMHAVQGWCPPLPILRNLGFRTQTEIDYERYALKALRGDFETITPVPAEGNREGVRQALEAVTQ